MSSIGRATSLRTRFEIIRRDGFKCYYCGASAHDGKLTVDHVVPVSLGGITDPSNMVAACGECNIGKSSTGYFPFPEIQPSTEFRLMMMDDIRDFKDAFSSILPDQELKPYRVQMLVGFLSYIPMDYMIEALRQIAQRSVVNLWRRFEIFHLYMILRQAGWDGESDPTFGYDVDGAFEEDF